MKYQLTKNETDRLKQAITVTLANPFIDDIEDFIWEAIFCYAKSLPTIDPLTSIRSKRLFDIVDRKTKTGWSAKAVQWPITPAAKFELVIQRADIFKKAKDLGFKKLDKNSPTNLLGRALLRHWYEEKVIKDAEHQKVKDKRVCILLKSRDRKKFMYFEESITEYKESDIEWRWTDASKTGLQGIRKVDSFCIFRWYPNQKQLFERFEASKHSLIFKLEPKRLPASEVVSLFAQHLSRR